MLNKINDTHMSKTTRITGDYTIDTSHTVLGVPTTGNVRIVGNLILDGESTTINTTDMNIEDNTIVLNGGETGAGVTEGFAGIDVDRGTLPDVGIRWNESSDIWELTTDGSTYSPIVTTTTGLELVLDTSPQLGGDLDVNGFKITSANNASVTLTTDGTGQLLVERPLSLVDQVTAPTELPGVTQVYGTATVGGGGTGVSYARDGDTDELISRNRAIVYSMIF